MIPRALVATAEIPNGGGTLRLIARGGDHVIMLGANELMSSRLGGSEAALATLACARILPRMRPRILIGGLGMGFTLRAALDALPGDAEVCVAELVPEVVAWASGPLAALYGDSLADLRVAIRIEDVAVSIAQAPAGYDAILLDVDNGPDGLAHADNDALYSLAGLAAIKRALRPRGVLAVWSSAPDSGFTRRLASAGFAVEEVVARAARGRGGRHVIWLAVPR